MTRGNPRRTSARPWRRRENIASLAAMSKPPSSEPPAAGASAGFICLEPWLSGPDSLNTRAGCMELSPGEEQQWTFTIDLRGFLENKQAVV